MAGCFEERSSGGGLHGYGGNGVRDASNWFDVAVIVDLLRR